MMRIKSNVQIICAFLLMCPHLSCKKEKSSLLFTAVESGTYNNIYAIRKLHGDSLIACGGENGKGIMLVSADEGISWKVWHSDFDQVLYDVHFVTAQTGFAGGGIADVFKTNDGGYTWEKLYIPFPAFPTVYRLPLRCIYFVNDSLGFICGGGDYQYGTIFKTTDQGRNWTLALADHELRSIIFLNETTGFACGYGALLKTNDTGSTWNFTEAPNEFYSGAEKTTDHVFVSGYNGSIINSADNGQTWQTKNKGNSAASSRTHFNCIVTYAPNSLMAAGNDGAVALSSDDGNTWQVGESFNRCTIKSVLVLDDKSGVAAGDDGKIFKFSF